MSRRPSTVAATSASIQRKSAFTTLTFRWLEDYKTNLRYLDGVVDPAGYKKILKRKLFGLEICKILGDKDIGIRVKELNEKYYDKIMNADCG